MEQLASLQTIEISFQTAGMIPPPYAHRYHIKTRINRAGELNAELKIEYFDREELTEEEIVGEGFTGDDDFSWEGVLLPVWAEALARLVENTKFFKKNRPATDSENQLWLNIEDKGQAETIGKPKNNEEWEYFSQELIQAIYETAKVESPLKLIYLKKSSLDNAVELVMNVFFAKRTVRTQMRINNAEEVKDFGWEQLNPVLKLIYAGEFLVEKATQAVPDKTGKFLNVGDGLWYEFGQSLVNPSGNNRYLHEVEKHLDDLSKPQ